MVFYSKSQKVEKFLHTIDILVIMCGESHPKRVGTLLGPRFSALRIGDSTCCKLCTIILVPSQGRHKTFKVRKHCTSVTSHSGPGGQYGLE